MSGTGLARYGVTPPTIVREPTRDDQGVQICAECGHVVEASKGPHKIQQPDVLDHELRRLIGREIVSFGWSCDRHPNDVIMPALPGQLPDGWAAVRIAFSDGHERLIPVPERELEEIQRGESA